MARLGSFALFLALAVCVYGLGASIVGARKGRTLLVESARTSAFAMLAMVAAAVGAMLAALIGNDFSIQYVAENSSRATPVFFKVLSLWSADQGSLLLWNLIMAGYLAAVAFRFRRRRPETLPWALAVLYGVQLFYLLLVMGPTQPFKTLPVVPLDGQGPLPLLQNNPLMAVHPPLLYLGFIGLTVPFAFAIAALLTGNVSDAWIRITRRWALAAWCCLTAGLMLGALWSYGVLGWGGFWAWDPVENVALLPWLVVTAFLHAVRLQERRGMLKTWNLSLVIAAFSLATFGTFIVRGSILESVHAFAASPVGPMFLAFLILVLAGGFGLLAARSWRFASEGRIDSATSRESAFVGNNLALLAITVVVLLGTIFPLFDQALTGAQVSVGAPYFEKTTAPIFLLLLFLMGVGPAIAWRRASGEQFRRRITGPVVGAAAVMAVLALLGVREVGPLLAFGLAAFVLASNGAEMYRGVRSYARGSRRGPIGSITGAVSRNRRRYGGMVVHCGVAIAAIAIVTAWSFPLQTEVTLHRGESAAFAGYRLTYAGERILHQPQRDVLVADVAVSRGGQADGALHPSLSLYPGADEPIGTPSIRYGALKDFYSSLISFDGDGSRATFRFFVNPGVMWVWVGLGVMVLGGLLAAWPVGPAPPPPAPAVRPDRRELAEATA